MKYLVILLSCLMMACSTVHTENVTVHTLGRAGAEVCTRYFRQGLLIKEVCVTSTSDAFSGWVVVGEIFNGIAEGIVKILTLGLL